MAAMPATALFEEIPPRRATWRVIGASLGFVLVAAVVAFEAFWYATDGNGSGSGAMHPAYFFLMLILLGVALTGRSHHIRVTRGEIAVRHRFRWRRFPSHAVTTASLTPIRLAGPKVGPGERLFHEGAQVMLRQAGKREMRFRTKEPDALMRALDQVLPSGAVRDGKMWTGRRR